jgi:hypothetical protein
MQKPICMGKAHESQFSYVAFKALQFFGIVGSQIEAKGYLALSIYA